MSNTARCLDDFHMPLPGELTPYRPSVSLQRLRNAPDVDDMEPGAMACPECGSERIRSEWREISAQTMSEPAENDVYATCSECGEGWPVDDLRDLGPRQRPS